MKNIEIGDFKGLYTNADPEDIPPEFFQELRNLRAVNGKLEKTFGMGLKVNYAIGATPESLFTFIHDNLTGDKLYLAVTVTNGILTVYYFTGSAWAELPDHADFTIPETYYHKDTVNPILADGDILRILPGNVYHANSTFTIIGASTGDDTFTIDGDYTVLFYSGVAFTVTGSGSGNNGAYLCTSSTLTGGDTVISVNTIFNDVSGADGGGTISVYHASKGLWIGWIDREYFDGNFVPGDYTAEFYGYSTNCDKPTGPVSVTEIDLAGSGFEAGTNYFYKASYIYDGIQESLLSDILAKWTVSAADKMPIIQTADITYATFNKRITAMKVYRATAASGPYEHIHTIDFLRSSEGLLSGLGWPEGDEGSGADSGPISVHVPALATYDFDSGKTYKLSCGGSGYKNILAQDGTTLGGTGHQTFHLSQSDLQDNDEWDSAWILRHRDDSGGNLASGSNGFYGGPYTVIVPVDLVEDFYIGGIVSLDLVWSTPLWYPVDDNVVRAVHSSVFITNGSKEDEAWALIGPGQGFYKFTDDTTKGWYQLFDLHLTEGAVHPLDGEFSTQIHGRFARVIGSRLWQGDIILDPLDTAEIHADWVSYSELLQYDVNPVSNVIKVFDREGGPIMGIAEMFGNPVILKKQAVILIDVKSSPSTPAAWAVIESAHNIGNVAPFGYIEAAGDLYVCWYDGIYRLSPNNLAATDSTPTERLKISGPIEDIYLALTVSQKEAITVGYDPLKSEIVWTLGSRMFAFNVTMDAWREIVSAIAPVAWGKDEDANLIVCLDSDKKVYTFDEGTAKEAVATAVRTKVFEISDERKEVVRYVAVTYRSPTDTLTLTVISEDDVPSGSIQTGVVYMNDGYSKVTYNGADYTDGQAFSGIAGVFVYTTTGSGNVMVRKSTTLPATKGWRTYRTAPAVRSKKISVQISSASSTNDVEIGRIRIETD